MREADLKEVMAYVGKVHRDSDLANAAIHNLLSLAANVDGKMVMQPASPVITQAMLCRVQPEVGRKKNV